LTTPKTTVFANKLFYKNSRNRNEHELTTMKYVLPSPYFALHTYINYFAYHPGQNALQLAEKRDEKKCPLKRFVMAGESQFTCGKAGFFRTGSAMLTLPPECALNLT
jgi:hypothetical protein